MIKTILILFFCLLGISYVSAQEFVFDGNVKDMDSKKDISGVVITATVGGSEIKKVTTDASGNYTLSLPIDKEYKVTYSKAGYVAKHMTIDARGINEEDLPIGGKIMPSAVNLDLFTNREGGDFSFLQNTPVVHWKYKTREMKMAWDANLASATKKRIDDELAKAEKSKKDTDAKYNALITEADALYKKEDYTAALTKYEDAIKLDGKQMEKHPNMRILEISDILDAQKKKDLMAQQSNQAYQNLIDAAEQLVKNEQYDKAIDKFYEASDLTDDNQLALDRIDDVQKLLNEKKKRTEYDALIEMADKFYDQNSMQAALDKYEKALKKYPNEQHPLNRKAELEGKAQAEKEEQERKKKYNDALEAADKLFNEEKWEESIEKYKEALSHESASTYPNQKIELAEENIEKRDAAKKLEEDYAKFMEEGEAAMKSEDYAAAVDAFSEANQLKPEEELSKTKKEEAEQKLKEIASQQAEAEQIAKLLEEGGNFSNDKKWQEALAKFQEVLTIDDSNDEAKKGKEKAEKEIEALANQEALMESFEALKKEGADFLAKNELDQAEEKYKEADNLIPNDDEVKEQLGIIAAKKKELEEQANEQEKINQLLSAAQEDINDEKWSEALTTLDEVLRLDEKNETAIEQKELVQQKQKEEADLAKQNELFASVKQNAEELYKKEEWIAALAKYEEANEIQKTDEVSERIEEIKETIKSLESEAQQEELLKEKLAIADGLFNEKKWEESKLAYNDAKKVRETEHITERLVLIDAEIEKLNQAASQQEKWQELVNNADAFYDNEELEKAKQSYEEAKGIESNSHIEDRLTQIEDKLTKKEAFAGLVAEGDELFNAKDYKDAIKKYDEALGIQKDEDVQSKKEQAQKALDEEKSDAASQIDMAYNESMERGEQLLAQNKFDEAIMAFDEALVFRNGEDENAQKRKEFAQEQKQNFSQYQTLLQEGDELSTKEDWDKAKEKYIKAQGFIDSDEIKKRIENIDKQKAALEEEQLANQEKQLEELLSDAREKFENGILDGAFLQTTAALEIDDSNEEAQALKEEIEKAIKDQEAASAKENDYAEAMERGKKALENENFAQAIEAFDDALEILPNDDEATSQKEVAREGLQALAESEEKYQELLAEAKAKLDADELLEAKALYEQAQDERKTDPIPQNAIVKIDEMLRKKQEEAELAEQNAKREEEYAAAIDQANEALALDDLKAALSLYEEASEIKEEDEFPKKQIATIKEEIQKRENLENLQKQYATLIEKGDEAFENKLFDESINFYEEALKLDNSSDYPVEAIEKAKTERAKLEAEKAEFEYAQAMTTGRIALKNEDFEESITQFEEALNWKKDDEEATEKLAEAKKLLQIKQEAEKLAAERLEKINDFLSKADSYFANEEYEQAINNYDEVLSLDDTNGKALRKKEEAKELWKQQRKAELDAQYEALLTDAALKYDDDELEEALALYEQANEERPMDQVPVNRIKEIRRKLNKAAVLEAGLDYLGEEEDISIIEGAFLLEQAEQTRKNLRKQKVVNKIQKQEENFQRLENSDLQQRLEYEWEADKIRDLRMQGYEENNRQRQELSVQLDDQLFEIAKKRMEENNYERGAVLRQAEDITYILDEAQATRVENYDRQYENSQIMDDVANKFGQEMSNAAQQERQKYIDNNQQIIVIQSDAQGDMQRAIDFRGRNEEVVRQLNDGAVDRQMESNQQNREKWIENSQQVIQIIDNSIEEENRAAELLKANDEFVRNLGMQQIDQNHLDVQDNYAKITYINDQALQAELLREESSTEKAIIQNYIQEDIYRMMEKHDEKRNQEQEEVYTAAWEMDAILTKAQDTYAASAAENDLRRQETVEQVKDIAERSDAIYTEANTLKINAIRGNMQHVGSVELQRERALEQKDENHAEVQQELERLGDELVNIHDEKSQKEESQRRDNSRQLTEIKVIGETVRSDKSQQVKERAEKVDGVASSIGAAESLRKEDKRRQSAELQELLDGLELNQVPFNDKVANTLGDQFPEGVTQENYVKRDKDDLPYKIITRRIVVQDGRGDVYLRIQTRNMITYSKNGQQISEMSWINGTEHAKLVRHF